MPRRRTSDHLHPPSNPPLTMQQQKHTPLTMQQQKPARILFFTALLLTSAGGGPAESLTSLPHDAVSLLAFKALADLDNKLLYTTNERFDFCQWRGVKCAQGRVVRYSVPSCALRGTIPAATLSRLDQLRVLSLRNNSLSGDLPDFSALLNLKTLLVDGNRFSGAFPPSFLFLRRLMVLDLSRNNFTGPLPENLTVLDRLVYLKLDSNRFSGGIPALNQTMLEVFDVSGNDLSGPVPVTPTLKKFKPSSFLYNPSLCGKIINKPCRDSPFFNASGDGAPPSPESPLMQNAQAQQGLSDDVSHSPAKSRRRKNVGLILGFVTGALILTAAVLSLVALMMRKRREEIEGRKVETPKEAAFFSIQSEAVNSESSEASKLKSESPLQKRLMKSGSLIFCSGEEELYTLEQLMRASAELLGRGTIGTTYKAVMANQLIVTVKRLDACKTVVIGGEEFEQHMENVGVLRHPNLVPVRAYFQAKQERLVIFDYQPNGSLFNLIHGSRSTRTKPLHWTSCLKIAEDIAQGLAYIHQASSSIHGNLKSSNVLLGPDFEACLTDYCLSPLLSATPASEAEVDPDLAAYMAPETRKPANRAATAKSDVYSFGVLLLELLTGRPPAQHPFVGPPELLKWVRTMRDHGGDGGEDEDDLRLRMLVEVAGYCGVVSPEQRPTMWQVLKMIANIKEIAGDGGGSSWEARDGYS